MGKRLLAILALAATMGLITPTLMADRDKGDKDKEKGNPHAGKRFDDDDKGWERREGYEYRTYDRDGRPPGWSHGKKTGWDNCGLPPGQAKKYGCRTYIYEGRPHYYYQDDQGRIIIRRPIISIHGGADVH